VPPARSTGLAESFPPQLTEQMVRQYSTQGVAMRATPLHQPLPPLPCLGQRAAPPGATTPGCCMRTTHLSI
jgi:hypothetical protein